MSAVGEAIAREYFEAHGFLVRQHRKYVVTARAKTADEEIDLLVVNPRAEIAAVSAPTFGAGQADRGRPLNFVLGAADLKYVARAIVAVKGWYTETFSPAVLTGAPEILKFVEGGSVKEAARQISGEGDLKKLLVVPALPASAELRQKSIELLRGKGVDGVLLFRDILLDLIARVETNKNYQKSDVLQTLRLLKNYDLLKEPQLELFERRRKRKPRMDTDKHR